MKQKPTMLYVSPFWPVESGISEYSEALVRGLIEYYDVTLLLDGYNVEHKWLEENCHISQYTPNMNLDTYDVILYNFGNQPYYHGYMYELLLRYPGYVILHDFVLYYLTIGYYSQQEKVLQKVTELEGMKGLHLLKDTIRNSHCHNLLELKSIAYKLPMNREVFELATGIIVHSEYTKKMVQKEKPEIPVEVIHLVETEIPEVLDENYLKNQWGIPDDAFVIGSAGFISETKQNKLVCEAVKKYNAEYEKKVYYVMIGEGAYVDSYLDEFIIKLGFTTNQQFFSAIKRCNLIMNLRYPYHGESSATLIQCMGMQKVCVVTNVGWFSEIPDETVIKVATSCTVDELYKIIDKNIQEIQSNIAQNAKNYVSNHCKKEVVAKNLYDLMSNEELKK